MLRDNPNTLGSKQGFLSPNAYAICSIVHQLNVQYPDRIHLPNSYNIQRMLRYVNGISISKANYAQLLYRLTENEVLEVVCTTTVQTPNIRKPRAVRTVNSYRITNLGVTLLKDTLELYTIDWVKFVPEAVQYVTSQLQVISDKVT